MIKSIIFDWGGVLIDKPSAEIITYLSNHFNVSEKEFRRPFQKYESAFQEGRISEDDLWTNVCSELKVKKPSVKSLWIDAFKYVYREKKDVFSLASSLKKNGYKTGFLSNTEAPTMKFFYEQGYDMFDVLVFSCDEGIRKPNREIYEIMIKRLNVQPQDAILIDDKEENIKGAEKAGLKGILFKDINQLKQELFSLSVKID